MSQPVYPPAVTDAARLDALASYGILDTPAEPGFDGIVQLACRLCDVPVALVSLVAEDRQWFKAHVGFPPCETDLNSSVCAHALGHPDDLLVIQDLSTDPRTATNPLVTGEPFIRFYAGAPLRTPDGFVLGSLCVIDEVARPQGLTESQQSDLRALAEQVMSQLELRKALKAHEAFRAGEAYAFRAREALLKLSDQLTELDSDTASLADAASSILGQTLDVQLVGYGLVDPEAETITVERDWTTGPAQSLAGTLSFREFGSHTDDLKRGETVIVTDARTDPRTEAFADALEARCARAFVNTPVFEQGSFIALLYVSSCNARVWTEDELQFIREVASRTRAATARRRAEEQLRAGDERFKTILETVESAFAIVQVKFDDDDQPVDYRFVEANPAFERQAGVNLRGRWVTEFAPDLERFWFETYGRVAKTGEPATFENYAKAFERWFDVRAVRVGNPADRTIAILFSDVTARRSAEERLRASEALARENIERVRLALAAGAIIGTWFWDLPSDRFTVDEAFAHAFGLDPSLGRDGIPLAQIVATVHPDDQAGLAEAINEAITRGGRYAHQYRVRRHDGRYYWLEANGHVDRAPDGTPLSFPGVLIDVEDRRAVEAERDRALTRLRDSEERFRALLTATSNSIYRMSADWQEMRQLDGRGFLSDTEAPSVKWLDLYIDPTDRPVVTAAIDDAIARKGLFELEHRVRQADGSFGWTLSRAVPLFDRQGDITEWFGAASDVTARRAQEARLLELNETLEQRVLERTTELMQAEEALRQSQKMEAVGQLTGGVAHDFNNLLTIIRSSVDFLRRPDLPEDRRKRYMDAVSDTVDRAAKLTGQLLAFARRQALLPEVLNVGDRLRAVADMLDTITGARVRVVTQLPDKPCFIKVDLSQFETALVNMAVNARDAMDGEGTLTLRLTCGGTMPPIRGHGGGNGSFAKVELSDTGSGIAEPDLARIFEPFFTTKEVGRGTGLGLSQVIGFAKQSGGDVDVTSTVGKGTTFTMYLPEVEAEIGQDAAIEESGPVPGGTGQRILVVEDNIEVGQFATQILEDLGYRTVWAANAEDALGQLGPNGNGIEVVFSDVVMPGMGGIALAEELRRRVPDLPVILASGYSHVLAQDTTHGFELLHKPYSADQLSRVLRRVTGSRRRKRVQ